MTIFIYTFTLIKFVVGDWASLLPDIPPGHRILLSKFVKHVRKQVNPYSKKSQPVKSTAYQGYKSQRHPCDCC